MGVVVHIVKRHETGILLVVVVYSYKPPIVHSAQIAVFAKSVMVFVAVNCPHLVGHHIVEVLLHLRIFQRLPIVVK